LSVRVEIYEAKQWPIDLGKRFDPIDVLNYAIDELGHTQAELAELLKSRSRASEILSRRRPLTVDMIHKGAGRFSRVRTMRGSRNMACTIAATVYQGASRYCMMMRRYGQSTAGRASFNRQIQYPNFGLA
jgi:hypothetical protein